MPDSPKNFAFNPFQELDASLFPKPRESDEACQDKVSLADRADTALFLRAIHNLPNKSNEQKNSGFTLGEHPAWQNMPKSMKKKNNPKITTVKKPQAADNGEKAKPEDDAAFIYAMRDATPLKPGGRMLAPRPQTQPALARAEASFEELMAAQLEFSLLYSDEYLEGYVAGLDEALMNRLRSGAISPEAHLDLHGLNAAQAYENLKVFMRDAWFKGLRMVLIVPGRGKNSPSGLGILRQKLQSWLTQEPFKRVVLAFCTAKPHDGGPGSIYVLLRRHRKKGRIFWERFPVDADLY